MAPNRGLVEPSRIKRQRCNRPHVMLIDIHLGGYGCKRSGTTGEGANLAKVDIKSAYRIVLVDPEDRMLLGMQWKGKTFLDTRLPFGL